jgi:hypothetical protein
MCDLSTTHGIAITHFCMARRQGVKIHMVMTGTWIWDCCQSHWCLRTYVNLRTEFKCKKYLSQLLWSSCLNFIHQQLSTQMVEAGDSCTVFVCVWHQMSYFCTYCCEKSSHAVVLIVVTWRTKDLNWMGEGGGGGGGRGGDNDRFIPKWEMKNGGMYQCLFVQYEFFHLNISE